MLTENPEDLTAADIAAMTDAEERNLPEAHRRRVTELAIEAILARVPKDQLYACDAMAEMRAANERDARMTPAERAAEAAELAEARAFIAAHPPID